VIFLKIFEKMIPGGIHRIQMKGVLIQNIFVLKDRKFFSKKIYQKEILIYETVKTTILGLTHTSPTITCVGG
jgi:hypothetical protein